MTFRKWIKGFRHQESAIGDLARDMEVDHSFPISDDRRKIRDYLKYDMYACDGAIEAFEKAYDKYLHYTEHSEA